MGHGGACMSDIRLEEIPFEIDGKTYLLRCNMNVLADVQEVFGGRIIGALKTEKTTRSVLEFLAAMLNDYADEQGWSERWTAKTVGRKLRFSQVPIAEIMGLVRRALLPAEDEEEERVSGTDTENPEADSPGN